MANEQLDEKAIFNVARQIDAPDARRQYLDQVCGADSALLKRVLTLLQGYEEQASFLESLPIEKLSPTLDQPITEMPGAQIGGKQWGRCFLSGQTLGVGVKECHGAVTHL